MKRGHHMKKVDLRDMRDFSSSDVRLNKVHVELGVAVSPHEALNKLAYKVWMLFEESQ
jgi:hypothetical protein